MSSFWGCGVLSHIVTGMRQQGYDVELKQYPGGWRADFYTTGIAHSVVQISVGANAVACVSAGRFSRSDSRDR